jgi:hypothetical protein
MADDQTHVLDYNQSVSDTQLDSILDKMYMPEYADKLITDRYKVDFKEDDSYKNFLKRQSYKNNNNYIISFWWLKWCSLILYIYPLFPFEFFFTFPASLRSRTRRTRI